MTLDVYFQENRDRWIKGKDLADILEIQEREVRDRVKSFNLFLVQSGSKAIVCSNNGRPNGYNLTDNPKIINRYRLQQRALAQGIHQNERFAEIVLKRHRTIEVQELFNERAN